MNLNNTYAIALIVSGAILLAVTIPSLAAPGNGSNLGECYDNWIIWCDERTAGYPDCYAESMDYCDGVHNVSLSLIPAEKVNALRAGALRKAKRATTRMAAPAVQPVFKKRCSSRCVFFTVPQ